MVELMEMPLGADLCGPKEPRIRWWGAHGGSWSTSNVELDAASRLGPCCKATVVAEDRAGMTDYC